MKKVALAAHGGGRPQRSGLRSKQCHAHRLEPKIHGGHPYPPLKKNSMDNDDPNRVFHHHHRHSHKHDRFTLLGKPQRQGRRWHTVRAALRSAMIGYQAGHSEPVYGAADVAARHSRRREPPLPPRVAWGKCRCAQPWRPLGAARRTCLTWTSLLRNRARPSKLPASTRVPFASAEGTRHRRHHRHRHADHTMTVSIVVDTILTIIGTYIITTTNMIIFLNRHFHHHQHNHGAAAAPTHAAASAPAETPAPAARW